MFFVDEDDLLTPSGPTKNSNDAKDVCHFKAAAAFVPNGNGIHDNVKSPRFSPADPSSSHSSPVSTETSSHQAYLKKGAQYAVPPDDLNNNNANVTGAHYTSLTQNQCHNQGYQGQHYRGQGQGQGQSVFAGNGGSVLPFGDSHGLLCSQSVSAALSGAYASPSRHGTLQDLVPFDSPQRLFNSTDSGGFMLSLPRNTCHFCGAVKKGPADLQRHLRKHTGERPFICLVSSILIEINRFIRVS